ncbi:MAG: hypothetical protein GYA39_07005 [Methanothrix sp.]|nr:hypothetical protein [Methanothrix sp.]
MAAAQKLMERARAANIADQVREAAQESDYSYRLAGGQFYPATIEQF